jgi:hypothetical protein
MFYIVLVYLLHLNLRYHKKKLKSKPHISELFMDIKQRHVKNGCETFVIKSMCYVSTFKIRI